MAKRRITQIMPHYRPGTFSFQMGCFVVAEFLLTSVSRGPSAVSDLVNSVSLLDTIQLASGMSVYCRTGLLNSFT